MYDTRVLKYIFTELSLIWHFSFPMTSRKLTKYLFSFSSQMKQDHLQKIKSVTQQGLCTLIGRTCEVWHVHRDLTSERHGALPVTSFCAMYSDDRKAERLFSLSPEPRHTFIERDSARHRITTVFSFNRRTLIFLVTQCPLLSYNRDLKFEHY